MNKKKYIIVGIFVTITMLALIAVYKPIQAYLTNSANVTNKFKSGDIGAAVEEPNYVDRTLTEPGSTVRKDPVLSNTGTVSSYIRAQIYVPISKDVKYVNENEEIVTPTEAVELVTYELNSGWEMVTEEGFSGQYEDEEGNQYQVYTYKYVENGVEKVISPEEKIETAVFNEIEIINYLDIDATQEIEIHVTAIAVQSEGGTADEMWQYYKNQNQTGIAGVK